MEQEQVWNNLAEPWARLRTKPQEGVEEFLRDKDFVLDLGCGSGRNFIAGKKYIAIDFSENMLRYAKQYADGNGIKVSLIKADLTQLPLKPGIFDTVIMIAALHALENRDECLKEMKRVMNKRAEGLITVWNKVQPRFFLSRKESYIPWKAGNRTYLRYYYLFTKSELRRLLSRHFTVKKIFGSKEKDLKLFPKNIIAIVRKP